MLSVNDIQIGVCVHYSVYFTAESNCTRSHGRDPSPLSRAIRARGRARVSGNADKNQEFICPTCPQRCRKMATVQRSDHDSPIAPLPEPGPAVMAAKYLTPVPRSFVPFARALIVFPCRPNRPRRWRVHFDFQV